MIKTEFSFFQACENAEELIKAMSQLNVEFDLRIYRTLINHGLDSLNN